MKNLKFVLFLILVCVSVSFAGYAGVSDKVAGTYDNIECIHVQKPLIPVPKGLPVLYLNSLKQSYPVPEDIPASFDLFFLPAELADKLIQIDLKDFFFGTHPFRVIGKKQDADTFFNSSFDEIFYVTLRIM